VRGGDISNEVPLRVAVALDCIIDVKPSFKKVLGIIPVVGEDITYNRQALSLFWRFAEKFGYVLELVGFGYSQKEMDEVMEDLNNLGTNPFNYVVSYPVVADLVAELPYRPELVGVVDIPARGLRYGGKFIDLGRVNGS
jgi:hypothetical protein